MLCKHSWLRQRIIQILVLCSNTVETLDKTCRVNTVLWYKQRTMLASTRLSKSTRLTLVEPVVRWTQLLWGKRLTEAIMLVAWWSRKRLVQHKILSEINRCNTINSIVSSQLVKKSVVNFRKMSTQHSNSISQVANITDLQIYRFRLDQIEMEWYSSQIKIETRIVRTN